MYERALEDLLKVSAAIRRPHPNLQASISNYAGCLQKLGRSDAEIRDILNGMMRPFGMSLGGDAGGVGASAGPGPSPRLRAVIEQLMREPSRLQEVAARLQEQDPALFTELVQWLQSQRKE